MTSKFAKKLSIPLIIILILVSCIIPSFGATTGTYEYNDFSLYDRDTSSLVTTGVFRSNTLSYDNMSIRIYANGTWTIAFNGVNSTATQLPCPSGKSLDTSEMGSNGAYVRINGNTIYFQPHEVQEYWYVNNIPTSPYYPAISIYLPYTVSGSNSNVPSDPTLYLSGAQITWSPSEYTAKLIYTSNNIWNGSHQVISNSITQPYNLNQEGYYKIALNYTDPATQEDRITSWSNTVHYVPSEEVTGPLNQMLNTVRHAFSILFNAVSSVFGFLGTMGSMLNGVFGFLPADVVTVYWSVVIIALILSLL